MEIANTDFSQFKLRVTVKSGIEDIYRAWTTTAGLDAWFLGKTTFTAPDGRERGYDEPAQPGDAYALCFARKPDEVALRGKVLKANGQDVYSFSFADYPVTITIYSEHNDTIVELFESHLPTETETLKKNYMSHSKGWVFYLLNLKSVLEGGLDLRNRNRDIVNVINH